jgi:hypothetical protein
MPAVGGDQLCANSPRSDSDYAEWLSMADGRPQLPAVRQHRPCRRCRFLPPQRRRLPSFGFNRGKTRQGAAPTDPPSAFASRRSPVRSRYAPHASRGKPGFPRVPPRYVHALPAKNDYRSIPAAECRARHVGRGEISHDRDGIASTARVSDTVRARAEAAPSPA